jgi:hypothetical protein
MRKELFSLLSRCFERYDDKQTAAIFSQLKHSTMLDKVTAKLNAEFTFFIKSRVEPREWEAKNYNGLALLINFCFEFSEREKLEGDELKKVLVYMQVIQKNLRQGQTARAIQYWIEANSYELEIQVNRQYLIEQVKKQSRNNF